MAYKTVYGVNLMIPYGNLDFEMGTFAIKPTELGWMVYMDLYGTDSDVGVEEYGPFSEKVAARIWEDFKAHLESQEFMNED